MRKVKFVINSNYKLDYYEKYGLDWCDLLIVLDGLLRAAPARVLTVKCIAQLRDDPARFLEQYILLNIERPEGLKVLIANMRAGRVISSEVSPYH